MKRHVRGKLQRSALSLTGLAFQVEHIDGVDNLWADLLSRCDLPVKEVGVRVQCKFITRSRAHELAEAATRLYHKLRRRMLMRLLKPTNTNLEPLHHNLT